MSMNLFICFCLLNLVEFYLVAHLCICYFYVCVDLFMGINEILNF